MALFDDIKQDVCPSFMAKTTMEEAVVSKGTFYLESGAGKDFNCFCFFIVKSRIFDLVEYFKFWILNNSNMDSKYFEGLEFLTRWNISNLDSEFWTWSKILN